MLRATLAGLMAAFVLLGGVPALAQSSTRVSVEVSGGYLLLGGDAFAATDDGMGFEAQLRLGFRGGSGLGIGYYRSKHSVPALPEDIAMSSVFADVRYYLPVESRLRPYVAARLGLMQKGTEVLIPFTGPVEGKARGTLVGAGAGLSYMVTSAIDVMLAAGYDLTFFGDSDYQGERFSDTSANGSVLGVRLGVSVGFGGR